MPGNCSTYNLFYVAVWSLNEALTFNLLSLFQFLFFLNWFDFLKVLFFFFIFLLPLIKSKPHALATSLTRCVHSLHDFWSISYDLSWNTQEHIYTESTECLQLHLHFLKSSYSFFYLFKYQRAIWMFRVNNVAESKAELTYLSFRV